MFGKKEEKTINAPGPDLKVITIPGDFYAGADPMVKFKEVEKTVDLNKLVGIKAHEKKALDAATAAGGQTASLLSKRWFWVVGGASLFALFAVGAGVYYWWQNRPVKVAELPAPPVITAPEVPVQPTTPPVTEPPTTTPEEIQPPVVKELGLEFPSRLLGESVDFDQDKVSDEAEELFGTDPSAGDTDKDSYADGHELYFLYNPNGFEPKKIIDSGYVKNFINPNFGYEMYYPNNWVLGTVDTAGRQVLFSTLSGENVEVRVFDLEPGQTLTDWFSLNAPDENVANYSDFQSRFSATAKMRDDGLAYIFYDANRVFAVLYHTTDSNTVNYKIVLTIMARSFKIGEPTALEDRPAEELPMIPETMATGSEGMMEDNIIATSTTGTVESSTTTENELPAEEEENTEPAI